MEARFNKADFGQLDDNNSVEEAEPHLLSNHSTSLSQSV
jgi:hypothetical protein